MGVVDQILEGQAVSEAVASEANDVILSMGEMRSMMAELETLESTLQESLTKAAGMSMPRGFSTDLRKSVTKMNDAMRDIIEMQRALEESMDDEEEDDEGDNDGGA